MNFRTDLALEAGRIRGSAVNGVELRTEKCRGMNVSRMYVKTPSAAEKLGKACGTYITVEGLPLTDDYHTAAAQINAVSELIQPFIPEKGTVLVIGIGNTNITPDALGPAAAGCVIATRHISGEIAGASGLDKLRSVAVLSPGVLGQTGIDVSEIILSLSEKLNPGAVIAIDALCSCSPSHLGRTLQISDSGIAPGSGIGNNRPCLNKDTMGIPVIGIGIPTVADSMGLACELLGIDRGERVSPYSNKLMVTPKEIDLLIERASRLIGMAINCALQSDYSFEELSMLSS